MDLFMSSLTPQQQWKQLKIDYKAFYNCDQNGQSKFSLIYGDHKTFSNCVVFVLPHVTTHGFMNAEHEIELIKTLKEFNITNHIITYAQLNKSNGASSKLIKTARPLFEKMLDIIKPKLIVAFDEITTELFLNQKSKIIDNHGTVITTHFEIPVILTYNFDYYTARTGYENKDYKKSIFDTDWDLIIKKYKELICL
jgi:hypothetical protein